MHIQTKRMWRSFFFFCFTLDCVLFHLYKSSATDVVARYFHLYTLSHFLLLFFCLSLSEIYHWRNIVFISAVSIVIYNFMHACLCVCPVKCIYIIMCVCVWNIYIWNKKRCHFLRAVNIWVRGVVDFFSTVIHFDRSQQCKWFLTAAIHVRMRVIAVRCDFWPYCVMLQLHIHGFFHYYYHLFSFFKIFFV